MKITKTQRNVHAASTRTECAKQSPKMRRTYTKSMLIDPVVKKPAAIKTDRFWYH